MERSYDDDYGFSSRDILSAAISAAELAEVLDAADGDELDDWGDAGDFVEDDD